LSLLKQNIVKMDIMHENAIGDTYFG